MKTKPNKRDKPSTATQLASAMQALGMYSGANTEAEHTAEAKRVGGDAYYRMLLVNALLGGVETEAIFAESSGVSPAQMHAAHRQALDAAGAADDAVHLLGFLRWRTLRVAGPLREIAQNRQAGPVPLAAAHAAEGLQQLLAVCAAGQNRESASPSAMKADLKAAREALTDAVANIDSMLDLVAQAEEMFG